MLRPEESKVGRAALSFIGHSFLSIFSPHYPRISEKIMKRVARASIFCIYPFERRFRVIRKSRVNLNTLNKMKSNLSKGFTLVEIMIVVVIIGLLAAMAVPAFNKVRTSSVDKAVMNNARQMAAAADQYFLENGVTTVVSASLVGSTNYVKSLIAVAAETYPAGYTQSIVISITGVAGSRTITYAP